MFRSIMREDCILIRTGRGSPANLFTAVPVPNAVRQIPAFRVGRQKLLIFLRRKLEVAINVAAAELQIEQIISRNIGCRLEDTRFQRNPVHRVALETILAKLGAGYARLPGHLMDHLQRLFADLADLEPAMRDQYFDQHQVSADLRGQVESLLHFDDGGADPFMNTIENAVEEFLDSNPERYCGPYELIRLLGQGGMGSVYLAQRRDGEVDLRVAIKFIRGADATHVFRNRFFQERQILAQVNHPGITRMLDAGHTASGRPYLVMEYVDGVPIDAHCRELSTPVILRLFLRVCEAVAYLHRNLIVHRDLKPSNILVQSDGSPRVLDFGVAKILDKTAEPGTTKERILTLDYASPEQVTGSASTTLTDIYSLGAVLYQLLTGQTPHASRKPPESLEAAICGSDLVSARTLNSGLPRDLDLVLRKSLRKEPAERYPTVDALADDLRAILESRPVKVRSGDVWYRTRKFGRRHWLPVSAVTAAIVALSIGLYTARREESIAEQRFAELRQLSNRVLALDNELRGLPGATNARERLVSASIAYLDGLKQLGRKDPDLTLEAANGYRLAAEVQGVPVSPSLAHYQDAEASLAKAAGLVQSVVAAEPQRAGALLLGAEIEQDRMIVADTVHDWPSTELHAARAAGYANSLGNLRRVSADQQKAAARIFINIGQAQMNMRRYDEAVGQIRAGIRLARRAGAPSSVVAQGLSALANAQRQAGELESALVSINEARALSENAEFPNNMLRASAMYAILWRQGLILGEDESVSLNRPADALEPLQAAFTLVDGQAAKDPSDASFRERAGTAGQKLGDLLRHSDPARALIIYDRTLARLREIKGSDSAHRQEARVLAHSSYPLRTLRRIPEAQRRIDAAVALLQNMGQDPSTGVELGGEWDDVMRASADQKGETGHPEQARATLLGLQTKVFALNPDPGNDLHHAFNLSRLYASIARFDRRLGMEEESTAVRKAADESVAALGSKAAGQFLHTPPNGTILAKNPLGFR